MEAPNYTGPIDASKKLEIAATFLGKFYYFFPHNSNQGALSLCFSSLNVHLSLGGRGPHLNAGSDSVGPGSKILHFWSDHTVSSQT